jgi:ABC-type uncharacterized transport system ATPase subunit
MTELSSSERIRVESVRTGPEEVWSFVLRAGEALWIPEERDSGGQWLDWLTGIGPPPAGEVFWKGAEWRRRGPDEAVAERGRIGCVFAQGGLVANLDMDENVWLPARMHRREKAEEEIGEWARFFGCWPLPPSRAPAVPERLRRRILWTRAFAGRPEAMVLERPLPDAAPEDRERFLEGVRRIRERGCAVVWLDRQMTEDVRAALEPLAKAEPRTA